MQNVQGRWAGRFIWAAMIQGLLAVIVTLLWVDPTTIFGGSGLYYSASRVVAGGGGGTWFFVGYVSFLLVGVIATAVTAIFYFYIEGVMGKAYKGLTNYLAGPHLALMTVGVDASMFIMMRSGYLAGWAAAPATAGGGGLTPLQIHSQVFGSAPLYIGIFVALACLGASWAAWAS
jgi:hypothetical protein